MAPVRVPSQRPLAPSVTSVKLVDNDKGDNEMILGAVHRSPGICLTAEENLDTLRLRKTSARRQSDEVCATSHRLKWGPKIKMKSVRSQSTSGNGEKKGMGGDSDEVPSQNFLFQPL